MRLILVLIFSTISLSAFAQVDQRKLDSLSRSIDSTAKVYRTWQDSFARAQDSIYQTSLSATTDSINANKMAVEQKEKARRKEALIRIGIGVFSFLLLLFILLMRRGKQRF